MLAKKIFVGGLASLLWLGLAGVAFAQGNEQSNSFRADQVPSVYMTDDNFEFDFSSKGGNGQVAVNDPFYMTDDNFEFNLSPRGENSQVAVVAPASTTGDNIGTEVGDSMKFTRAEIDIISAMESPLSATANAGNYGDSMTFTRAEIDSIVVPCTEYC